MDKFVIPKNNSLMKRAYLYGISMMLMLFSTVNVWAQTDDVYYDPTKDVGNSNQNYNQNQNNSQNGNQNSYDDGSSNQNYQQPSDKNDGYGSAADKYDYPDQTSSYGDGNGNTYITNNYYDNDEDFYYTNRLNRYYRPNWGMDYYSYQFTPSYYYGNSWGYNSWNRGISISFGTWYNDPWGPWGSPYYSSYSSWYNPWSSPYWGWNMGWNSCGFYNGWYGGGFCSTPYMSGWGGYYGGGWGGYGYGYNQGYWNGNNTGYYD